MSDASATPIGATLQQIGSMWTCFFTDRQPVRNFSDASACDTELFGRFFRAALAQGVLLPPSQFEAAFVSVAHDDGVIDEALQRFAGAIKTLG